MGCNLDEVHSLNKRTHPTLSFCAVHFVADNFSNVSYQLGLYPESCFSFLYELHKVSAGIGHIHDSCFLLAIMTEASLWFKCGELQQELQGIGESFGRTYRCTRRGPTNKIKRPSEIGHTCPITCPFGSIRLVWRCFNWLCWPRSSIE